MNFLRAVTAAFVFTSFTAAPVLADGHCNLREIGAGECPEKRPSKQPTAPKMSDEEIWRLPRDERRTKWIEGVSCQSVFGTTLNTFKYKAGGIAIHDWIDDQHVYKWYVKNDQFCTDSHQSGKHCSNLPDYDVEGEKEWLQNALATSCHN